MPRDFKTDIDVPRPRVHSSITPYEQNVSRTAAHRRVHKYRGVGRMEIQLTFVTKRRLQEHRSTVEST